MDCGIPVQGSESKEVPMRSRLPDARAPLNDVPGYRLLVPLRNISVLRTD